MESLFVTVQEAAKILNQGYTKIHNSLQQGKVPFGYATKMENQWSYTISRAKLYDFLGIKYIATLEGLEIIKAPKELADSMSAKEKQTISSAL